MADWLLKSDAETYGLADLERDGRTVWDGVSNPAAVRNIRAIQTGDRVLLYHTGKEKAVVGVARAATPGRPDPRRPALAVFDLEFMRRLARPVPLAAIKDDRRLSAWALVRQPRLSVMPVPATAWDAVLALAGERA